MVEMLAVTDKKHHPGELSSRSPTTRASITYTLALISSQRSRNEENQMLLLRNMLREPPSSSCRDALYSDTNESNIESKAPDNSICSRPNYSLATTR